MGLHQAITDKNTAEPCDCAADDDHHVYTEADAEDQLVDYDEEPQNLIVPGGGSVGVVEDDRPEGLGLTSTEG